jgi:hypothetical protein
VALAMIAPLILVFVASADADGPVVAAMVHALERALGEARVTIQGTGQAAAGPAGLAEAARGADAAAAVSITLRDGTAPRAAVTVHVLASGDTHDQTLTFEPSDPPGERGRAIGFLIASYLLPAPARAEPVVASAPAARGASPAQATRWALEAFGAGGLVFGGAGTGLGGGLALRTHLTGRWGLRLSGRALAGSVDAARASSLNLALAAGGFRALLGQPGSARPSLALRGEALLLRESLTHFSPGDPTPVQRGRWLSGAAVTFELEWPFAPAAAVHLGLGLELELGRTDVFVGGVEVAHLGPVRGVGEAGFRARF